MDYTSKLLSWREVNQIYFDSVKNHTNHEIVIAVSYTHLDVYKRQVQERLSFPFNICSLDTLPG